MWSPPRDYPRDLWSNRFHRHLRVFPCEGPLQWHSTLRAARTVRAMAKRRFLKTESSKERRSFQRFFMEGSAIKKTPRRHLLVKRSNLFRRLMTFYTSSTLYSHFCLNNFPSSHHNSLDHGKMPAINPLTPTVKPSMIQSCSNF